MTKRDVDRLRWRPDGPAQQVLYDETLPGFGVRVYPSGKKSFIVRYRTRAGRTRLLTLGRYGALTIVQARELALRTLAAVAAGGDPLEARREKKRREQTAITLREFARIYLDRHAKRRKKTWREDERRLERHVLPRLGRRRLDEVKRADVARLHAEIGRDARYEANRVLALISVMYSSAVEWGFLEEGYPNPAARVKPFEERSRERWITPEELPILLRVIGEEEDVYARTAFLLYLYTGLRRSELLALRWVDVHLERREIHLRETKAGRPHTVPLSAPAAELLASLPRMLGNPFVFPSPVKPHARLYDLGRRWDRVRRAFVAERWAALHPTEAASLRRRAEAAVPADAPDRARAVRARWRELVLEEARRGGEDAGLEVRLHDLRRTVGSMLALAGHSLPLIGKVLNHSNPDVTSVYARIAEDAVRRALEEHGARIAATARAETA